MGVIYCGEAFTFEPIQSPGFGTCPKFYFTHFAITTLQGCNGNKNSVRYFLGIKSMVQYLLLCLKTKIKKTNQDLY